MTVASWRSGYAEDCKSFYGGSIPSEASSHIDMVSRKTRETERMSGFADQRRMMVDCQLRTFDVTDRAVLAAFEAVPREAFVDGASAALAYSDATVPAANAQRHLLKPMVLARMIQSLAPREGDRALVVAGATGYGAAILARMGAQVVLLESDETLVGEAERILGRLGVAGVEVERGPLEQGLAAKGPYDVILVEGIVELFPAALVAQLGTSGKLVVLQGDQPATKAVLYRHGDQTGTGRTLFDATGPVLAPFRRPAEFVF